MPSPSPMQPDVYYHIFNRGTNGENIFIENRNYAYFLTLYIKYIEPVAATYAYCLMRNHFHVFMRVYTSEEKAAVWDNLYPNQPFREFSASQAFSNLFNAYAKAIQKAYGRTGSVFEHPYHRIPIKTNSHFINIIPYIHANPQKHGFVDDFRDWPYSSYQSFFSSQPTRLKRDETLEWFSGTDAFRSAHELLNISEPIHYLIEGDE